MESAKGIGGYVIFNVLQQKLLILVSENNVITVQLDCTRYPDRAKRESMWIEETASFPWLSTFQYIWRGRFERVQHHGGVEQAGQGTIV